METTLVGPKTSLAPTVKGPKVDEKSFEKGFNEVKDGNKEHTKLVQEGKSDIPTNAVEALAKEIAPAGSMTTAPTVDQLRHGELNRKAPEKQLDTSSAREYNLDGTPQDADGPSGATGALPAAIRVAAQVASGVAEAVPQVVNGVTQATPQVVAGLRDAASRVSTTPGGNYGNYVAKNETPAMPAAPAVTPAEHAPVQHPAPSHESQHAQPYSPARAYVDR